MPKGSMIPKKIIDELKKSKNNPIWIRELARAIGCHESTIRYHLRNMPEVKMKRMIGRNKILLVNGKCKQ